MSLCATASDRKQECVAVQRSIENIKTLRHSARRSDAL